MLFAPTGELVSMNDDALAWLDELPPDHGKTAPFDIRFPIAIAATLMRARAIAEERDHGSARARLRSAVGHWLVCHASCLRDAGGAVGSTALVVEAAKTADLAPLIVATYALSERELEITRFIARGLSTADIAQKLFISPHTVRDHVKTIFDKAQVSSRGELVAKLFTEHYEPLSVTDLVRVTDN
jgi:DNA-binding CsgD family transcriptional regulator